MGIRRPLESLIVILAAAVLLQRYIVFIHDWAVNLPFSDNWQTFTPLFEGQSYWEGFLRQHGPHRLGIGFVVTMWLMKLSDWNLNWESYFALFTLAVSAILFLCLRLRLVGHLQIFDIAPVALLLSKIHYETILIVPSAYHSIVPLFLLLCLAFIQTWESPKIRYGCGALLAAVSLYSGFGVVVTGVMGCLLLLESVQLLQTRRLSELRYCAVAGLVFVIAGICFLATYVPQSGAPGEVRFPHWPLTDYLRYIAAMFGGVLQLHGKIGEVVGGIGFVVVTWVFVSSLQAILVGQDSALALPRLNSLPRVLLLLSGTSFVYAALTAVGRVHLGLEYASGSRYMTLLVPGFIACYLFLDRYFEGGLRQVALTALMFLVVVTSSRLSSTHKLVIVGFQTGKQHWIAAYKETTSLAEANRRANFPLLCATDGRIEFLKSRKLSGVAL